MIPASLIEAVAREACRQMGLDADADSGLRVYDGGEPKVLTNAESFWQQAVHAIAFSRAIAICDVEQTKGEG